MLTGVFGFLAKGGLVMIPLGVCSVLAVAVVIERAVTWLRLGGLADSEGVLARVESGKWTDAIDAGERSRSPVALVLGAGVRHRNPAARLAMETAAQEELARLRRYLPVLDTVVTLSPLLGLLGTVTGMIGAFGIMAQAGLNQPTAITGGVAEALIATAAGLGVAICALVPYNFFQRRAESMAETIERYGSRLELLLAESQVAAATGSR